MKKINRVKIGRYVNQIGGYKSFTLFDFPPKEGFVLSSKLYKKHEEAVRLIGKLDGITRLLPDKDFFLSMFIKKDATHSSQIEGTKATLQDAVSFLVTEEKNRLPEDVDDINHYVEAVNYSIQRIKTLPISLRLIKEIHEKLMTNARSTQHAYPGEFRHSQNWINGKSPAEALFVPPAPLDMEKSLDDLEKFIHSEDDYPLLIKAGLIHAQFETIHPFTDGNGRTGRMLVVIYIYCAGLLELPVLYLSSYFKKYQETYYQKLQKYHDGDSDVEAWLSFFLEGIIEIANSSIDTCNQIIQLYNNDSVKIKTLGKKSGELSMKIIHKLFSQPIVGISEIMEWTGFSRQGAYKVIERLKKIKILELLGEEEYDQKYIYSDYYQIFDDDFRNSRKKL